MLPEKIQSKDVALLLTFTTPDSSNDELILKRTICTMVMTFLGGDVDCECDCCRST